MARAPSVPRAPVGRPPDGPESADERKRPSAILLPCHVSALSRSSSRSRYFSCCGFGVAQIQVVRSAYPLEPTGPSAAAHVCTRRSTTRRGSKRCDAMSARQACLLLREVVLREDICGLSSARDVAITLNLALEVVLHCKRVTKRFELVDAVTVPNQGEANPDDVSSWPRSET